MLPLDKLDDLANKLSQALPDSFKEIKTDVANNFKSILQVGFAKMHLVNREEFDKQTALLQKAREKLAALEEKVHKLESKIPHS